MSSKATPLTAFYKTQADAIEAARARGVDEVEVTFRPNVPGAADIKTKVSIEAFAQLWGFSESRKPKAAAKSKEVVPSAKLARALKEASQVTTFYDTKDELFSALEKQS